MVLSARKDLSPAPSPFYVLSQIQLKLTNAKLSNLNAITDYKFVLAELQKQIWNTKMNFTVCVLKWHAVFLNIT
jgi:hypothetical protein